MSDCIFCKIVAGTAPCDAVHEDDLTITFMDLFPVGRGHLLIVPKAHAENLFEVPGATLERIIGHSRRVAFALRNAFSPDGIAVHQLNGAAAGQTVFHYHMHLIPRWNGDPTRLHGRQRGDDAELVEHARLVKEALAAVPADLD